MKKSLIVIAGSALVLAGCSSTDASSEPEKVIVEVGGDYEFASYDDGLASGIEFPEGVSKVVLEGETLPKNIYVIARPTGRTSEAWCKVTVDGEVKYEDHTKGSSSYATCSSLGIKN